MSRSIELQKDPKMVEEHLNREIRQLSPTPSKLVDDEDDSINGSSINFSIESINNIKPKPSG